MENQNDTQPVQMNVPSLYGLKCPKCNAEDLKIIGSKGSKGKAMGIGMAFGAIGNLVANSLSKDDITSQPIEYKCKSCRNKFVSSPLLAQPEEILMESCTINFKRMSSFVGMAVSQFVWLNGMKVGSVKNGGSLTFQTAAKNNTLFVADQYGVAFKSDYKFEAQPGGSVEIKFKGKFL